MVGTNTNIMNIMHEEHPPVYWSTIKIFLQ